MIQIFYFVVNKFWFMKTRFCYYCGAVCICVCWQNVPLSRNRNAQATSDTLSSSRPGLALPGAAQHSPANQRRNRHRVRMSTSTKVLIGVGVIAGVGACSWAYVNRFGIPPSLSLPSLPSFRTSTVKFI